MYPYLLFDLDGTLTDPLEGITKSVAYALHSFGIDVPPQTLTSFIGPPLIDQFMAYANFDRETALAAVAKYRERFKEIGIFENRLLDGVPEMLSALRDSGHILCVSSSKPEVFVHRILAHFGLSDKFSVVCGSELDGTRCKKSEVIEETLSRLSRLYPDADFRDRKNCLMIGDRIHDIEGARACRMDAVGVTFGYAQPGELENSGAVQIVSSWDALIAFVEAS